MHVLRKLSHKIGKSAKKLEWEGGESFLPKNQDYI